MELTYDEAVRLAEDAVAERGEDWVYPAVAAWRMDGDIIADNPARLQGAACRYVVDEGDGPKPGCIIGLIMSKAGVPLETLAEFENNRVGSLLTGLAAYVDLETTTFLDRLQQGQDRGQSWGEALRYAK